MYLEDSGRLGYVGFATEWRAADGDDITLMSQMGTLLYMAPEMIEPPRWVRLSDPPSLR